VSNPHVSNAECRFLMPFAIGRPLGIRRVSGTGAFPHRSPRPWGKYSIDGSFDSADNVAMVLITGDLVTQVVDVDAQHHRGALGRGQRPRRA